MKSLFKLFAVVALALCVVPSAVAKDNKAKNQKVATKIETVVFQTDIDCPSCEAKIMKVLPYQKGVKDVKVNMTKKSVTVSYDSSKISESAIISILKKLDVKVVDDKKPSASNDPSPVRK